MKSMLGRLREGLVRSLRWSEKYTKTDMVYLAGAGFWTNLNFGITSILAFLLSIAFANFVPREVYGFYQYLISLSAIITALTLAGMNGAITQSVARGYEGDLRASVRAQLVWNVVPMLIGLLGALYYELHGNGATALGLVIIAVFAPLVNTFNTYSAFLAGTKDFKRMFWYATIVNFAYYPTIFVAMLFAKGAVFLVFVNLATNAAAAMYVYYHTLKTRTPNPRTDPTTIPYGKHLSVMNAFGTIITQIDSVLVYHFLGPAPLAVYSFATLIPERLGGLFNFVGSAAFPKFANRSIDELRGSIVSQTARAALGGGLLAVLYSLCAPLLFQLVFPKYLNAIPYTQWYSLIIVMMTANLVSTALQAKRLKTELYIMSFVNPIMLIVLQIPLLLLYGIMGMIVARLISDGIGIGMGLLLLFRAKELRA